MESATENSLPMADHVGSGDGETVRVRKGADGRKAAG